MRRGMNGLALQVQQALGRDPHAGDLYVFRGARGDLIKIIWHDGIGMSLYAKRLEKGRFVWPSPADGVVGISAAQLAYMLDGIDWRNPRHTFRPSARDNDRARAFFTSQPAAFVIPSGHGRRCRCPAGRYRCAEGGAARRTAEARERLRRGRTGVARARHPTTRR